MRTLIVPDVHEDIDTLEALAANQMAEADRVVMLGDFFDSFKPRHSARIATWLRIHLSDPKFTILWGNHDISYAFGGRYRCSGYDWHTQHAANRLDREDWMKFKVFTRVGAFLCSHAGFTEDNIHMADDAYCQLQVEKAFTGASSELFAAGMSRGGSEKVGGPLWLDWNYEFKATPFAQIVGHTYEPGGPRVKVYKEVIEERLDGEPLQTKEVTSYCLDNGLHQVMWIDEEDGGLMVENL